MKRSPKTGAICNLEKTQQLVNPYSVQIMDPPWGHLTIKTSAHPPFAEQVILNGHEYLAYAGHTADVRFCKEGTVSSGSVTQRLAQIADALSHPGTAGRLGQVINAWIDTA